jgi:hypothetical protein
MHAVSHNQHRKLKALMIFNSALDRFKFRLIVGKPNRSAPKTFDELAN